MSTQQLAYLAISSRVLVGALLLFSGVLKMMDRSGFRAAVRGLALIPNIAVSPFAILLPALEIAIGGMLALSAVVEGPYTSWAVVGALGLFLLFGCAIAISLLQGRNDVSCGCFGGKTLIGWHLVARSGILFLTACPGLVHFPPGEPDDQYVSRAAAALVGISGLMMWKILRTVSALHHEGNSA